MENSKILKLIKTNSKSLRAYYPYPTGGNGLSNVIVETSGLSPKKYNHELKNIINLLIQLGASVAGYNNDNKTAVKINVDGLDFPIYCYKYDGKFVITKEINYNRSKEIKIHWTVE